MRHRFSHALVSAAAVLAALLALPSWSQSLPAATASVQCFTLTGGTTTVDNQPTDCSLPGVHASLTLAPEAGATVHADYGGGIASLVQASASIQYYFQITGGSVGDFVPLLIATRLSTAVSAPGGGSASVSLRAHTVSGGAIPDKEIDVCSNVECGGGGATFAGTLSTIGLSGDVGDYIVLNLLAGVGDSFDARSADASADPWIYIDPTFSDASKYSVLVSDGVGNAMPTVPAIPEPSTFALIALGMGALLRKRLL